MTIERTCPMCGKKNVMELTDTEAKQLSLYQMGFGLIQDIFPDLNPLEREFVNPRSGYCPECQALLFGSNYTSERIKEA
jgi:rubredoxin